MFPVIERTPLEQLNRARRARRPKTDHYMVTTTALEKIRGGVEFWFRHPKTDARTAQLLWAELKHLEQRLRYA